MVESRHADCRVEPVLIHFLCRLSHVECCVASWPNDAFGCAMPDQEKTHAGDEDAILPTWPQFGMRSLMAFVSVCCALAALAGIVGRLWAIAIGWLVLMVAVHVAANAWGSRLRVRRGAKDHEESSTPPMHSCGALPQTGPNRLRNRTPLGWGMVAASSICGTGGGLLGVSAFWFIGWDHRYSSLAVAGISAAVLGAFLGFLASSFVEVAMGAWLEASRVATASPMPPAWHSQLAGVLRRGWRRLHDRQNQRISQN